MGMTTATTSASRQPIANRHEDHDRDRCQSKMEEELVRFLVGGLAVIASDGRPDVFGKNLAAHGFETLDDLRRDRDCVGAGALGDGEGHRRRALSPLASVLVTALTRVSFGSVASTMSATSRT